MDPAVPRRASDEELLADILQARIERWLEQEGVFHVAGFGDVALADRQLWRADITITVRPAWPGEAGTYRRSDP
jgi:hypothetical protein